MKKAFTTVVNVLVAGMMLLGNALAQQAPAAKTSPTSPAKTAEAPAAQNPSAPSLTTQKDKCSYALGMNLGTNLRKQSIAVDPDLVLRGLEDGIAGGKTLMTEDEARVALNELRKKQQEKMQQAGEANKKEREALPSHSEQPAESAPTSPSVELKEGQTPEEVEKILGKPQDTMSVKDNLIYVYPTVKVIFEKGKLVDVQYPENRSPK